MNKCHSGRAAAVGSIRLFEKVCMMNISYSIHFLSRIASGKASETVENCQQA